MRTSLLAAAAALAISSPAVARDGVPYVGVEGGILFGPQSKLDLKVHDGTDEVEFEDGLEFDYKLGLDADFIAGYDFGPARAELELGYKRSRVEDVKFSDELADAIEDEDLSEDDLAAGGRATVLSLMTNVLFDVGGNEGWGFYAGGGAGRARVKVAGQRDSAWAWQLIAGARTALTRDVDLGLKYRYFNTTKLAFRDEAEDFSVSAEGKFRSHSLLASLTYNFGSRAPTAPVLAPAPAPAPVAPATQTCADGSVIVVTEACPIPVAPPPPPPAPSAGERG